MAHSLLHTTVATANAKIQFHTLMHVLTILSCCFDTKPALTSKRLRVQVRNLKIKPFEHQHYHCILKNLTRLLTEEELECFGHWRDGSQDYLVGKIHNSLSRSVATLEESYRCFVYEKIIRNGAIVGYQIAQSGDATCNGVYSSVEGARTLTLTKSKYEFTVLQN